MLENRALGNRLDHLLNFNQNSILDTTPLYYGASLPVIPTEKNRRRHGNLSCVNIQVHIPSLCLSCVTYVQVTIKTAVHGDVSTSHTLIKYFVPCTFSLSAVFPAQALQRVNTVDCSTVVGNINQD